MPVVEVSGLLAQYLSVLFQSLRMHLLRVSQSGAKRGSGQQTSKRKAKARIIEEPKKGSNVRLAREFMQQQWEVIVQEKQRRCGLSLAI